MENTEKKVNYWIFTSGVLVIIVVVLLVLLFVKSGQVSSVSSNEAGVAVLDLANSQGAGATLNNVNDKGGFYEVNLSIRGSDLLVYATKDGKYVIATGGLMPLTITNEIKPAPKDIPKSDKPVVKAYVFSYCPYGLQFEKALSPVYYLLKNDADIQIVFIGAMHDPAGCSGSACFEKKESLRQLCIEKNYGKDKLWTYLNAFNTNNAIGSCSGTESCINPLIEKIFTNLSIDKTKINNCITNDAPALYTADESEASSLGIGGSPTFTINGAQVNVARNPEAIKEAICNSFNTSPSSCSITLSTIESGPGFGSGAGSGSVSASCN